MYSVHTITPFHKQFTIVRKGLCDLANTRTKSSTAAATTTTTQCFKVDLEMVSSKNEYETDKMVEMPPKKIAYIQTVK